MTKQPGLLFTCLLSSICVLGQSSTLTRSFDPVVISGTSLPAYFNAKPDSIVGFRLTSTGWAQIPVQVDEKALLDIMAPYGPYAANIGGAPPTGVNVSYYTDPGTYTGADTSVLFDADDEVVFMVKDAGGKASGVAEPAGVIGGTGTEVTITDPLGGIGYIYLFQSAGSLQQNAGVSYVTYNYKLTNGGTYPQNFTFLNKRNPEDTRVTTANYSWHFAGEWISDEATIATGGAPNTDILDRHKVFFTQNCIRSENTFSDGDNAFATNKSGPIRAIRSYLGANSGPTTQRTHLFYEARQDIITNLRVHNIATINDAFDYNSNASGMKYRNSLNTGGVVINGSKDVVTLGDINWEMVQGSKGSVVMLFRRTTNISAGEATFTSYYDDNKTKAASSCTGDAQAWGTSGATINFNTTVCTETLKANCSTSPYFRYLSMLRQIYFESPAATLSTATTYNNQKDNPLQLSFASFASSTPIAKAMPQASHMTSINTATLYPNPSREWVNVRYKANKASSVELMVLNTTGAVVLKKMVTGIAGENIFQLDVRRLGIGLYQVIVTDGGRQSTSKLLIY